MPNRFLAAVLVSAVLGAPAFAQDRRVPSSPTELRLSYAPIVQRAQPAVVNVYAAKMVQNRNPLLDDPIFRRFFGVPGNKQPEQMQRSLGSGVMVDPSGLVVTNNHVIEGADQVKISLADKREFEAEIVLKDSRTDLAVLRVKDSREKFTTLDFANSDELVVGDIVLAIGNPFGLGGSLSVGVISARNRNIDAGRYDDFIQTDAAINRGNSGGPLFNLEGEVVGVNTLIISPTGGSIGLGFAVPSKTVAAVVDQLQKFGELRRGWLGVRIQPVTEEIAESLSIKPARGALVAGVDDKGPAKPAGIEPGDVVVRFDGKDIKDPKDLSRVVADTAVGKEVEVGIIRKGKEETRKVTLGRLEDTDKAKEASAKTKEEPAEKPVTQKALGLDLATLSKDLRTRYKIKDSVKGVIITGVDNASDAAEKRLSAGDVIVEVAQEAVTNAADVKKRIEQVKKDGKKSVLLLVANGEGDLRFVALSVQ